VGMGTWGGGGGGKIKAILCVGVGGRDKISLRN
jgi:hypothetical protein